MSIRKKEPHDIKAPGKRPAFFRFGCAVVRLLSRKRHVIGEGAESLSPNAIYLMNHKGARGPFSFEVFFPIKAAPWGAHEMCGNFRERWGYLYHVFYRQKLHWGKCRSFFVATAFATVSGLLYRMIGCIGTYTDMRLMRTMRQSAEILQAGGSILIFPENSEVGYEERPTSFHQGFMALNDYYYRKTGVDIPVYHVYYSDEKKTFTVSKPFYLAAMKEKGLSREEICNIVLQLPKTV